MEEVDVDRRRREGHAVCASLLAAVLVATCGMSGCDRPGRDASTARVVDAGGSSAAEATAMATFDAAASPRAGASASPATSGSAERPDPTAVDTLVWANVTPKPGDPGGLRTYWLAAGDSTYRVAGAWDGVLIAREQDVWRWVVKEYRHKVECADREASDRLGPTSTSLGVTLENVVTGERQEPIRGSSEPLRCFAIKDATITLLGSVGTHLFIRDSHLDDGGGAHGITTGSFQVWDLAARKAWGWEREIAAPPSELQRVKTGLATIPGVDLPDGEALRVDLRPESLRSTYRPDGALSLELCFEMTDTNLSGFGPSFSHGAVLLGECAAVAVPRRLAADATMPPAVVRFARDRGLTVGGWSRPAAGRPVPDAVKRLFAAL